MGLNKTVSLKSIIVSSLLFILVVAIGYKYYEWRMVSSLMRTSNLALISENENTQKSLQLDSELVPLLKEYGKDSFTDAVKFIETTDKLRLKNKLYFEKTKTDKDLYVQNLNQFKSLQKQSMFLIGSTRVFAQSFLNYQIASYDKTIKDLDVADIDNHFLDDYFMVTRDMALSNNFFKKGPQTFGPSMVKYIQNNFTSLGSLEKYTSDNFKFQNEDGYKRFHPYGYASLVKYRDYLKTYYSIYKDLANNDVESASYKASRLGNLSTDINLDYERLFNEDNNDKNTLEQGLISDNINMINIANNYFERKRSYPLLGEIKKYDTNLQSCNVYTSKIGIYNRLVSEYPSSTDAENLITELNKISPDTRPIDKVFDKSTLIVVSNDKDSINIQCRSTTNNSIYSVVNYKY